MLLTRVPWRRCVLICSGSGDRRAERAEEGLAGLGGWGFSILEIHCSH